MVGPALDVAAIGHADDNRAIPLPIRAVMNTGEFIEELVNACPEIIGKLNFGDALMHAVGMKVRWQGR